MTVPGFCFAGVACGIKPSGKKDLALIVSDIPATAVAAFTTNRVKAAPVLVGQERVKSGRLQAVVVNSGNANVSTGQLGLRLARDSCALVGRALGIDEKLVLPSSTGKIGAMPPWDRMQAGIQAACAALSPQGFWNALAGIMTTDAFPKAAVRYITVGGKSVTVAGMAKGAGMINPNMATMLCYVLTDARVEWTALRRVLDQTLAESFNAISVDGDMSTNDTLLLLANGVAGNREIKATGKDFVTFKTAVGQVLRDLARLVVKDGEGATHVVDIIVRGAKNAAEAERVARAVAYSPLVKTAFFGKDPNWGRIACAVGYAGAAVNPDKLDIAIGDVWVGRNGMPTGLETEKQAAAVMQQPEFSVTIDLRLGRGAAHVVTSDLSVGYVRFNSAYST
ncbi:MAG: bifunctional glutamate N-acetyltransferase/amino-acid acetyltransferase ArgJ [Deltaproteobacteria bacterium]|nr:bifunctional glutamate N-acetyltransferase/amino-acid acetyltransferase ArgJ [Deltaproteobacteria bacterium]